MKCDACGKNKDLSFFYKHKLSKNGYRNKCKECLKIQNRIWVEKNRDKAREYCKKYYKKNSVSIYKRKKIWVKKNYKKVLELNRNWRKKVNYKNYYLENCAKKYNLGTGTIKRYGLNLALFIYTRDNRKCKKCGTINDLTIHHLDGKGRHNEEKKLEVNNNPSNLIILCRKCHGSIHSKNNKRKDQL